MGTCFVINTEMTTVVCSKCGMVFAIPVAHQMQLRRSHESFYCPSGHPQYYPGESDIEKERRRFNQLSAKTERLERCCIEAQSEVVALETKIPLIRGGYKAQLSRLRKKG